MEENNIYSIFHILSRIIVVFAIIILITGLIIRFNQNKPNIQSSVTNQKPTIAAAPSVQSTTETISTSAAELNLKDSFACNFSSPVGTVSAFVKDGSAFGQIKQQLTMTTILLKGGCLYSWNNTSAAGKKICGLSPYISIFGGMPIANLLGNSQLLSMFGSFGKYQPMIPSILNSCKKQEVKDEKVFNLPKDVIFNESKTKSF